jgi:hypothetical protein
MLQNQIVKDGGYNKIPYFKTAEESNTPRPVPADVKPAVPVQKPEQKPVPVPKPEQKPVPVPEPEQKDDKPKSCLFEGGMLPHHSITETKDIFICNKYRTKTDLAHAETCACDCYDGEISCYTTSCEQGYEFDGYACISTTQDEKRDMQEAAIFTIENTIEKTEVLLRTIDEARHDRRVVKKGMFTLENLGYMENRVEEVMDTLKTLQDRIHRDNITKKEATQILNEAQALSEEIKDLGNHILEEEGPISLVKFEDWN